MYHSKLTTQMNTARKEIAKSRENRKSWENRYETYCNIAAMAKEDLLATKVENVRLNTTANELEQDVVRLQQTN